MGMEISRAGVHSAQQMQFDSARRVAGANNPASDANLVSEALTQNMSEGSFNANLAALKAQDEMMGTLLDVVA